MLLIVAIDPPFPDAERLLGINHVPRPAIERQKSLSTSDHVVAEAFTKHAKIHTLRSPRTRLTPNSNAMIEIVAKSANDTT